MTDLRRTPLRRLLLLSALMGGASLVEDTATGNPVAFETDVAKPLVSLIANFLPIQASGTPSPDNILPITGWDAVNVFHAGKNLIDKTQLEDGSVWWQGNKLTGYADNSATPKIPVVPGATYFRQGSTSNQNAVSWFDENGDYVSQSSWSIGYSITVPANAYFVGMTFGKDYKDEAMLFVGDTASEYEPFAPIDTYPASFPSTIYGGYVDMVTGEVWQSWECNILDGSEAWSTVGTGDSKYYRFTIGNYGKYVQASVYCDKFKQSTITSSNTEIGINVINSTGFSKDVLGIRPGIESVTSSAEFKTWLSENNVTAVYELASPVLITTLIPQQINAIKGNNTVWSDANGDCEITFLKKG